MRFQTLCFYAAIFAAVFAIVAVPARAARAQDPSFTGKALDAQEQQTVREVEAYLNAITTMQARFTQLNSDGTIDSGTFYLWRPGRLRFEYDAPKSDYIVADGLLIHYWDHGIKDYSNAPIGSTLADFLLRKKIALSGDVVVTGLHRPQAGKLVLTMMQKDNPDSGDVRLLLDEKPFRLLKWRVTDGVGNITETELLNIQEGVRLNPTLFRFAPPKGYDAEWKDRR